MPIQYLTRTKVSDVGHLPLLRYTHRSIDSKRHTLSHPTWPQIDWLSMV